VCKEEIALSRFKACKERADRGFGNWFHGYSHRCVTLPVQTDIVQRGNAVSDTGEINSLLSEKTI
jgi:hypothetical protein